jgi:riboflavin synthase
MFTGLIEAVGRVTAVLPLGAGRRLIVESALDDSETGESVAVNGVCLTRVGPPGTALAFDVSPETLSVTALVDVTVGSDVNLERALAAGARLGGHFVQGHVDATGRIAGLQAEGSFWRLTIDYPPSFARCLIARGAVAVDGISLTVAALRAEAFEVQIVPHTWDATTLRGQQIGRRVNLEFDMLGKYVLRALDLDDSRGPISGAGVL